MKKILLLMVIAIVTTCGAVHAQYSKSVTTTRVPNGAEHHTYLPISLKSEYRWVLIDTTNVTYTQGVQKGAQFHEPADLQHFYIKPRRSGKITITFHLLPRDKKVKQEIRDAFTQILDVQ